MNLKIINDINKKTLKNFYENYHNIEYDGLKCPLCLTPTVTQYGYSWCHNCHYGHTPAKLELITHF